MRSLHQYSLVADNRSTAPPDCCSARVKVVPKRPVDCTGCHSTIAVGSQIFGEKTPDAPLDRQMKCSSVAGKSGKSGTVRLKAYSYGKNEDKVAELYDSFTKFYRLFMHVFIHYAALD